MRRYETIFITPENTADELVKETVDKMHGIIAKLGGKVVRTDFWGRRSLAYEIKKNRRGQYVLVVYVGGSDLVAEIERNLHISELVIRFHTVKVADGIDLAAVVPEESQPAPAELQSERAPRREFNEPEMPDEGLEDSVA